MPNDLVETGSKQLTSVEDVSEELHLVALNADDMRTAQGRMSEWFAAKEEIARKDLADIREAVGIAIDHNWDSTALERQDRNALQRVEFYEKCKIASQNGFCIVPNMPADIFAIRTTRKTPDKKTGTSDLGAKQQNSNSPPAGEGEWKDSNPDIYSRRIPGEPDKQGNPTNIIEYFAHNFRDVEFPISVARPEVMSATAAAMALNVFDEMSVLPGRRVKGDPIVLGTIRKKWNGRTDRISFLIAWYLDTRTI